jgi:hypothetical protein
LQRHIGEIRAREVDDSQTFLWAQRELIHAAISRRRIPRVPQ